MNTCNKHTIRCKYAGKWKILPSKHCVLPVEVGARPECDEAESKQNKKQHLVQNEYKKN